MILVCKHLIMTETRAIVCRPIWVGISIGLLCVAYFYLLDRALFSSVSFSPIFRDLLKPDAATAWVALAASVLAALWKKPEPILWLVQMLGRNVYWVILTSVVIIAIAAAQIYHNYPLSMDEYAAVFQAKILASGHISARLPSSYVDWMVVPGFNGEFLLASRQTGRVVSEYWPGFALLLAPFEFLGVSWLCNALLGGLALYLIHWITREITRDDRAAGWALLFAIASGVFVADAISYYSMQAHLTANLLFVALLLRPTAVRALCAGLVGSIALILHNPLPHALFAAPWLIALAADRQQRRLLLYLTAGYLPGLAIGVFWLLVRWQIGAGQTPFNPSVLISGVFTWPNAALLNARAASLTKMWLWAAPCLFVFAFVGFARNRHNLYVRLLTASAVLTFVGYLFVVFDQGHGWGYRYMHSAWGVIPILAASALSDRSEMMPRLSSFAGASAILGLLIVVPLQMAQIEGFVARHLAQIGTPRRPGNNVFFIRPRGGFYVADMVQIDPYLREVDLILVSRGTELDTKMIAANWPGAIRIASEPAYDQWYLGSEDRRRPTLDNNIKQFVFVSQTTPTPPNVADR
jgi:hypothetical protein